MIIVNVQFLAGVTALSRNRSKSIKFGPSCSQAIESIKILNAHTLFNCRTMFESLSQFVSVSIVYSYVYI